MNGGGVALALEITEDETAIMGNTLPAGDHSLKFDAGGFVRKDSGREVGPLQQQMVYLLFLPEVLRQGGEPLIQRVIRGGRAIGQEAVGIGFQAGTG